MTSKSYRLGALALLALLACVGLASAQALRVAPAGGDPRDHVAAPLGGGDRCATVAQINTSPYTDMGNNCDGGNDIVDYNNLPGGPCNSVLYPGPDVVYQFVVAEFPAQITITLRPSAPADLALFVVTDCEVGTTCIAFQDRIGGGSMESVSLTNPAQQEYFVYVDSYYTSGSQSCGNYMLSLEGPVPVDLIDFSVE
jgi:hypothetical protein